MNRITNSTVVEDKYIAHLAGLKDGRPIGENIANASYGQKHPIRNKISASILGSITGTTITTLGVLASPFMDSNQRQSIIGSAWYVCLGCADSIKTLTEKVINFHHFIGSELPLTDVEQAMAPYGNGVGVGLSCATDEQTFMKCRAINYVRGVLDTVSNHYLLIGATATALVALIAYSKMNSYAAKEAKENFKSALKERFEKIATRLSDLQADPEIQDCAKRILQRQSEINCEIERLQLPSLSGKDIKQITQPVFDAAKNVQQKGAKSNY